MVGDVRCRVQNDKKKAKVRLWSMFAFNLDSHDCAEDQGLKFLQRIRVPEPVAAAIHAGIPVAFNTAQMPSARSVKMKICGLLQLQTAARVSNAKKKTSSLPFHPKVTSSGASSV